MAKRLYLDFFTVAVSTHLDHKGQYVVEDERTLLFETKIICTLLKHISLWTHVYNIFVGIVHFKIAIKSKRSCLLHFYQECMNKKSSGKIKGVLWRWYFMRFLHLYGEYEEPNLTVVYRELGCKVSILMEEFESNCQPKPGFLTLNRNWWGYPGLWMGTTLHMYLCWSTK